MTIIGETDEVAFGLALDCKEFYKVIVAASDGTFDVLLVKDL